jgi:alpha-glucosidase
VPDLVTYAAERGVGIWLWDRWQNLDSEREHRERLGLWSSWGVVGVKIDFTESDGQDRMRWFDRVLAATAHHRLMVNFHGGTIPRGMERTWPHFMTAEAVKGAENIKPNRGKDPLPPRHYVTLAFTRNVQGPMDFTPVTFTSERDISAAHELALSVLYESGVQHFADSVESYRGRPVETALLSRVPAVWDETRLLSGDPNDHIVLARRNGTDWYVAGGYATAAAQTVEVALPFLPEGEWTAELYQDSPANPHDEITYASTTTTRDGTLKLAVAPNGGFTIRLTPKG